MLHLKNDEDDDDAPGSTTYGKRSHSSDRDADFDDDETETAHLPYFDADDYGLRALARMASAHDERVVTRIVKRYYAAAATANGHRACSLLKREMVEVVPQTYGRAPGPEYMRGKTCAAVMTKLFRHLHDELSARIFVAGVRVQGRETVAVLGSKSLPASYIAVQREGGAWRVADILGRQLP